ncbi:MAG: biosynthetic-type acetolactate synthase large subunit [Rikenellaceae bacterium]|jgi:acetolactate synthase-1/2/3 large subunit|nr:biosynthetic-type acetolactate synthase large subunit [Rikenellaceae bacterium]
MGQDSKIKGSEALLFSLVAEGVDTVFGYPGGSIIPFYDTLYLHADKMRHILTRHEQGAVHAAQGYARASGRVGVCLATSGPGATNLITGIADAMIDSTPIVCVTAQVPVNALGTDFFQEADIISMTSPVTKWNYQVTRAEEIAPAIAKAFFIASTGRPGPVVIDVTKNALVELVEFSYEKCHGLRCYTDHPAIDTAKLARAVELLNAAERPLIIFGQGVKLSGAERALRELSERGNIPMASTVLGLSAVATDHPNYVGMVGMHGNLAPNYLTQHADVILAVGMRFSDRVTGDVKAYARQGKIIHIDIDASELGRIVTPEIAILGDAGEALAAINRSIEHRDRAEWFAAAAEQREIEEREVITHDLAPTKERITMGEVVDSVARATDHGAVIVTDVGQHQMEAARYSQFARTRSLITSGGLGTMGFGLPAAIGAKIAVPNREVVLFVGDGGLQMTIQELGTIMEWNVGVKIVLLNNSFLGMVRQWQQLFFGRRYSSTQMTNPDFVKIASAYDIAGRVVERREELAEAVEEMLSTPGAYFLEVRVDEEDCVFPMIPGGAPLTDVLFNAK